MKYGYSEYVQMFKGLADETRLKIVKMLTEEDELCACKILENFNITQPTLSYHMKILIDCGLVIGNKEGSWIHYRINAERIDELREFLKFNL
ncbi:MAG: metalloregulator ArsR/SmtB family transcription factor [Clostridium sp.]|uniref:ArsR/SmtB family transcription factor n=1 Tax=Clostridium sp. TaxID=1506 RepID=UPI0030353387